MTVASPLPPRVRPVDKRWIERAWERQDRLTKPPRALGRLEEVGVRLAGVLGTVRPVLADAAVIVCAGDHGVTEEGVSAFPAEVTPQMVLNFLSRGAAINQIARSVGATVVVLDAGVNGELPDHPKLLRANVRKGTGNIAREPAMSREEAERAIAAGMEAARIAYDEGATVLAAGDMGIGNTTVASALTAALTGRPAAEVTGRGTGVDEATRARKAAVVERAVDRARRRLGDLREADPVDVLAELGGLEIAAIAGVFLGGAELGLPLVTDGFPVTSGALVAAAIAPEIRDYLFAGHRSVEPGHRAQLEALGLTPLLDLDLRLGEGTGAVLAIPLLRAAAAVLSGMATFAEAGVSDG